MLVEALKKRKQNLDLSEEEKQLLAEFDSETSTLSGTIERLTIEKSNLEVEKESISNTVADLTGKLEENLLSIDTLKDEISDKTTKIENLEEAMKTSTSIAEAKAKSIQLEERQKAEQKLKEERDALDKQRILKEQEDKAKDDLIATLKAEKIASEELLKEAKAKQEFETSMKNIAKAKPYLADKIDILIGEVDSNIITREIATATISILSKTMNHDEEMEKYKEAQMGGSVVDRIKADLKKSNNDTKTKESDVDKELIEYARKMGTLR